MNKKYIFIIVFLLGVFLVVAQLIKPDKKELSYVYEKANDLEKLKVVYDQRIEQDPQNIELQKKYKNTLEQLRDNDYIEYSKKFYKKTNDIKTAEKIVEYYKANEDYENSLFWLEELYTKNKNKKTLKEIIDLSNFTKKIKTQKKYLREKFEKTNDVNTLFDLYNIGDKEFSLNELYKLALENKLEPHNYLKTFTHLVYAKAFDKANNLYFSHNLIEADLIGNKDLYIYLNEHYKNVDELKKIYLKLYEQTKDKKYFKNLEYFYVDEGNIKEFLKMHKDNYEKTKSKDSLDLLIRYSHLNEETLEYLKYLEYKAIDDEDDNIMRTIISEYIDLEEDEKLSNFLEKVSPFATENEDIRDILINSYVYLEDNSKAEEFIYAYAPDKIKPNLVFTVFKEKITKSNEEYFLNALSKEEDKGLLKKLFQYRYKNSTLFTEETYKYFAKPTTFNKLNFYANNFSKEEKEKIYFDFSLKSTDPQFLAQIAQYFLNENNYRYSQEISKNALSIYPNNKLALRTIALSSLWQKNYTESLDYLEELSSMDKNNVEAMFYLAQIFEQKNEKEMATKYYKKVLELSTYKNDRYYLTSMAKLYSPNKVKDEFETLIENSNYDEYLIAEYIKLYIDRSDFITSLALISKYQKLTNSNDILEKLKIQTLLAKKDSKNSQILLKSFEEKNPSDDDLKYFYQDLANIYFDKNQKDLAFENYKISQKLGLKNKALDKQVEKLKKYLSPSIKFNVGVQSEIKQAGIEAEYVDNFRAKVRYDRLEDYNSAKVELSDLNKNYTVGFGQDYYKVQINNILNQALSIYAKKEIDKNSLTTINDELIYKNYGLRYQTSLLDNLYLTSNLNYFDYEKYNFDRVRFENSFYYTFTKNYYLNFSYIFENVKGTNSYGYDDLSHPILAVGTNNTLTKDLSFDVNLGIEYKQSEFNPFTNASLYYDSKRFTSSFINSVSKDDLSNEYNYNSMLNFSYNFID